MQSLTVKFICFIRDVSCFLKTLSSKQFSFHCILFILAYAYEHTCHINAGGHVSKDNFLGASALFTTIWVPNSKLNLSGIAASTILPVLKAILLSQEMLHFLKEQKLTIFRKHCYLNFIPMHDSLCPL